MASIRSKVRELTSPRNTTPTSPSSWAGSTGGYGAGRTTFAGATRREFADVDAYVHERLMIWMSHKHGLRRRRNWRRFNHQWLHSISVVRLERVRLRPYPAHALR